MSDRVTGLGQTLDEFLEVHDVGTMADFYRLYQKEQEGLYSDTCVFEDLEVSHGSVEMCGSELCTLDDYGYELLSKGLNIPTAYMRRLDQRMRDMNVQFWLNADKESQATVKVRDGLLVDFSVGARLDIGDVFAILAGQCGNCLVWSITEQTNATLVDLVSEGERYELGNDVFNGGIRIVIPHSLRAPDIAPILFNVNSCAVIEMGCMVEPLNIKGMVYSQVLEAIEERVHEALMAVGVYFSRLEDAYDKPVPAPRRRISLYCREHNIPDRVKAYALAAFDDSGKQTATYLDLVDLFSAICHMDEVKDMSARRLQRLAGHIAITGIAEARCERCDAMMVVDDS